MGRDHQVGEVEDAAEAGERAVGRAVEEEEDEPDSRRVDPAFVRNAG